MKHLLRCACCFLAGITISTIPPAVGAVEEAPTFASIDPIESRILEPGTLFLRWPSTEAEPESTFAAHDRREATLESGTHDVVRSDTTDGAWSLLIDSQPPSGRYEHTSVYDPQQHRMIVFGGAAFDGWMNDVWILHLVEYPYWEPLQVDGDARPPRYRHTAVYDAPRNRVLVFGGFRWTGTREVVYGDLWALSLNGVPTWSRVDFHGDSPAPRFDHTAVIDPVRNAMLIFGGHADSLSFAPFNDLWQLDLASDAGWTRVEGLDAPSARFGHRAVFDTVNDRMIVFGGYDGKFLNDVWEWGREPNSEWRTLDVGTTQPGVRAWAAMTISDGRIHIQGGRDAERFLSDAWWLDTNTHEWQRDQRSVELPDRAYHTLITDARRRRLVMYGGGNTRLYSDLWLRSRGSGDWSLHELPGGRTRHAGIYDPIGDQLVIFGRTTVVFALQLGTELGWRAIRPMGDGPPDDLRGHSAVYDPHGHQMLVFGGQHDRQVTNGLWALELSEPMNWTRLEPEGVPPRPRFHHGAAFDPTRHRMFVSAGDAGRDDWLNDTWVLDVSDQLTWTQQRPLAQTPRPRFQHGLLYQPDQDRLLLSGGWIGRASGDTAELTLWQAPFYAWRHITNGPAQRANPLIWDSQRERVLLIGHVLGGDVLSLEKGASSWITLSTSGEAFSALDLGVAAYDSRRDRVLLHGGSAGQTRTWVLDFGQGEQP